MDSPGEFKPKEARSDEATNEETLHEEVKQEETSPGQGEKVLLEEAASEDQTERALTIEARLAAFLGEVLSSELVKPDEVLPGEEIDLRHAEAEETQSLKVKLEAVEVKSEEAVPEDVRSEEVKPEEVKAEEVKAEEVKAEEVKAEEVSSDEVKTEEVGSDEVKAEEASLEEVQPEEVKPEQVEPEEAKLQEIHADEVKEEEAKQEDFKAEAVELEEAKLGEVKAEEVKSEGVKPGEAKPEEVKQEEVKKQKKRKKPVPVNRTVRNPSPRPFPLPEFKPSPQEQVEALERLTEAKVLELAENVLKVELKAFEKKIDSVQVKAQNCLDKLSTSVQATAQAVKAKQADRDIKGIIRQVVIEAVSEQFSRVIVPKFEERLQSFFGNLTLQFEASLKEQAERTAIEESKLQSINSHLVSVIETEKAMEKTLSKGIAKHLGRLNELEVQIADVLKGQTGFVPVSTSLPEYHPLNPLKSTLDELLNKGRYEEAIQIGVDQADTAVLFEILKIIDPQALASQVTLSEVCRGQLLSRLLEGLEEGSRMEDYFDWVELCCAGPFRDKKQALKSFESLTILSTTYPRLSQAKDRLLNSLVA
jgi:hypothetical protein